MSKALIIISIILLVTSCKSGKTSCDAYGENHIIKKETKTS
jgi:hypothetical protein